MSVILKFQYATLLSAFLLSYLIILPVKVQMLLYTVPIIYIGSHLSLKDEKKAENLTAKDAMLFPVFGSFALLSLYLAYKYCGPWVLNVLVSSYVSLIGVIGVGTFFDDQLKLIAPGIHQIGWSISFPRRLAQLLSVDKIFVNVSVFVALAVGTLYFATKHFVLQNLLATAISLQGIRSVSLGSFGVAFTLLWGLFVYDVFWVFGTDVMVTVAKNFDAPIKLILPVSFEPWKNGLLGLGDIVIPGLFIALCLRFDAKISQNKAPGFFWATYVAYVMALIVTGIVMIVFKAAQPALLYLVPAVTGAAAATAVRLGVWTEFWKYTEEEPSEKQDSKKTL